ncbi:MAG: MBL fold metallo-hydrolase RNA specificity domain-containing protein [Acidimicrobiales bacterium]
MSADSRAPTLTFLGGAGTVTGSRFLVESAQARVLLDCGLFQGRKELRLRNWSPPPLDPAGLDAVVLTHAHVDHCGYLPALTAAGFRGRVYATRRTVELASIVLPDAGRLQEEEAAYANRKGFSKHRPARPLFTEADAHAALERFVAVPGPTPQRVAPGVEATFTRAGHILGAASVRLGLDGVRSLVWSGDLGRQSHPLLRPPEPFTGADVVLIESTYGDRDHEAFDARAELGAVLTRTAARGGVVVIPSFAVDRTEVLLYHLRALFEARDAPRLPVYVDSPMASAALSVYRRAVDAGDPELRPGVEPGDLEPPGLVEVRDVEASKRLHGLRYPSIIISAAGMATGGRVLHHLRHRLVDPRNTVLLPGYQAEGTRGRLLADGARHVKLLGRYVPVRAEVVNLPAFSVHADRNELLGWLDGAAEAPDALYVVHGEAPAAEALAQAAAARRGWLAVTPRQGEHVRLD